MAKKNDKKPKGASAVGGGFGSSPGFKKDKPPKKQPKQEQPKQPKTPGPKKPPEGTYDPALDAQLRASERGLAHLREDTATAGTRANEDLITALGGYGRTRDRSTEDITTSKDRAMQDYGIRETRGNRDFDTQLAGVFRQFGILKGQQGEAANAAGVLKGGTLRSAQKKRDANTALARAPIDTGRADLMEDLSIGRGRTGEDFTRGVGRIGEDYTTQVDAANRSFGRGTFDRTTGLNRGIAEQAAFAGDTLASKIYQSKQNAPELYEALAKEPKGQQKKDQKKNQPKSTFKGAQSKGWK